MYLIPPQLQQPHETHGVQQPREGTAWWSAWFSSSGSGLLGGSAAPAAHPDPGGRTGQWSPSLAPHILLHESWWKQIGLSGCCRQQVGVSTYLIVVLCLTLCFLLLSLDFDFKTCTECFFITLFDINTLFV